MAIRASIEKFRGYPLYTGNSRAFSLVLKGLLKKHSGSSCIFYLNPHIFNLAWHHGELRQQLRQAEFLLADGWGVVWAARRMGLQVAQRLAWSDHLDTLAAVAAKAKKTMYFWGGQPGLAELAAQKLVQRHRGLRVVGTTHGYHGPKGREAVFRDLVKCKAAVVVVGIGSPGQEQLCSRLSTRTGSRLFVTVGNALAFAAGTQRRAPWWIQIVYLEWLWRFILEPKKMWKRYLLGNLIFVWRVVFTRRYSEFEND